MNKCLVLKSGISSYIKELVYYQFLEDMKFSIKLPQYFTACQEIFSRLIIWSVAIYTTIIRPKSLLVYADSLSVIRLTN